jgi:hypothetical protein
MKPILSIYHFFENMEAGFSEMPIKLRTRLLRLVFFFLLILILFLNGCAGRSGFTEVKFKDDTYQDIKVFGIPDRDITAKYFGGFRFVFENTRDQWLTINNIRVSFADDSAAKYIKVLDPKALGLWGKAILQQQRINESDLGQLEAALVTAGAGIAGVDLTKSEIDYIASHEETNEYPENHLYAEEFILPPNFAAERWVVFESSNHEEIPYVTNLQLNFNLDDRHRYGELQFRPTSSRYKNFIWYDPARKEFLDSHLGVSISSAFPMAEFTDVANSQDFIINGFGLNAYITLLTNLGFNMALDYQTFESRAKLPIEPDSLLLLGRDFEFKDWQNISFLISPRFVLPINLKFDLFAELTGGVVVSRSPKIIVRRAGLEMGELDGEWSTSLAGGFALGFRRVLSKKLSLDLKAEFLPFLDPTYIYTSPENEEIEVTQNMSQLRIKAIINLDL